MNSQYVINSWLLDTDSSSLIHQESNEQRKLGEYQFKLLQVLAENAGKILSRDELNAKVWEKRIIGNNSLPNAVHALRVALDDNGKQKLIIRTVPKKGYTLEADYCQNYSARTEAILANDATLNAQPGPATNDREATSLTPSVALSGSHITTDKVRSNKLWHRLFLVQLALVLILSTVLIRSLCSETAKPEALSHNRWDSINLWRLLPAPVDSRHEKLSRMPSTDNALTKQLSSNEPPARRHAGMLMPQDWCDAIHK